jgi:hypothetical protein
LKVFLRKSEGWQFPWEGSLFISLWDGGLKHEKSKVSHGAHFIGKIEERKHLGGVLTRCK